MSQDPFDEYESGGPLANLARIKKVVGVPATLWLGLLALETILHAFDVPQESYAHRYLRGFVAYLLPLLLYWTVLATFYCSYTILNRRGGLKSVLTFGFVQALTYFILIEARLTFPPQSRSMSIAWTAIIALFVLVVIGVVSMFVRIPKEQDTVAHGEAASILMSGVLSMVIASLAYFRVQGEIEFLSWGVMLGVLAAGMAIRTDKLTLALLYFLDPRGAVGLYRLLEARDSVEDQRSRGRVAAETSRLAVEKRKTAAFRLANELEEQLDEVVHVQGSTLISATIDKLRNVKDPQSEESKQIVAEARQLIAHIRRVGDVPKRSLLVGATVAERIKGHRGLSESDILEAINSKLIDPTQAHLWTPEAQLQLADSADDIEQERTSGRSPILVADNLTSYFEQHPKTLEALTIALTAAGVQKEFRTIRGSDADGWQEFRFAMPTRSLSTVFRTGPNGDYLILGIFPAPSEAVSPVASRPGASPSR